MALVNSTAIDFLDTNSAKVTIFSESYYAQSSDKFLEVIVSWKVDFSAENINHGWVEPVGRYSRTSYSAIILYASLYYWLEVESIVHWPTLLLNNMWLVSPLMTSIQPQAWIEMACTYHAYIL